MQYHNRCINHLVSLSGDQREVLDEDLLAAAVILRFYEEVDGKSDNHLIMLLYSNHPLEKPL